MAVALLLDPARPDSAGELGSAPAREARSHLRAVAASEGDPWDVAVATLLLDLTAQFAALEETHAEARAELNALSAAHAEVLMARGRCEALQSTMMTYVDDVEEALGARVSDLGEQVHACRKQVDALEQQLGDLKRIDLGR